LEKRRKGLLEDATATSAAAAADDVPNARAASWASSPCLTSCCSTRMAADGKGNDISEQHQQKATLLMLCFEVHRPN
jgi:hypothetical protein